MNQKCQVNSQLFDSCATSRRSVVPKLSDPVANRREAQVKKPQRTGASQACEDIKAYHLEAVSAQPGARVAAEARDWLWRDTHAGKALFALRDACLASTAIDLQRYGGERLIPLSIAPRPAEWVYEAKWK